LDDEPGLDLTLFDLSIGLEVDWFGHSFTLLWYAGDPQVAI